VTGAVQEAMYMMGMGLLKGLHSLALLELCVASRGSRPGIGHDVALGVEGEDKLIMTGRAPVPVFRRMDRTTEAKENGDDVM
jgi:hypothetical protein